MTAIGYQNPPNTYAPQTPLQENRHRGGFMVSEANGHQSRDQGLLTGGAKVLAGTVLGRQTDTAGTAPAVTAMAGNTGNGTLTPDATAPEQVGVQPGGYQVKFDGAGAFTVFDPNGKEVGVGKVGAVFNNQLKFNTAAGSTPFAADDVITVTVGAAAGMYASFNPAAADGTENAVAILFGTTDATLSNVKAALITRNCEVNAAELYWPAGITTQQQAAATAQLAAAGIILR